MVRARSADNPPDSTTNDKPDEMIVHKSSSDTIWIPGTPIHSLTRLEELILNRHTIESRINRKWFFINMRFMLLKFAPEEKFRLIHNRLNRDLMSIEIEQVVASCAVSKMTNELVCAMEAVTFRPKDITGCSVPVYRVLEGLQKLLKVTNIPVDAMVEKQVELILQLCQCPVVNTLIVELNDIIWSFVSSIKAPPSVVVGDRWSSFFISESSSLCSFELSKMF